MNVDVEQAIHECFINARAALAPAMHLLLPCICSCHASEWIATMWVKLGGRPIPSCAVRLTHLH